MPSPDARALADYAVLRSYVDSALAIGSRLRDLLFPHSASRTTFRLRPVSAAIASARPLSRRPLSSNIASRASSACLAAAVVGVTRSISRLCASLRTARAPTGLPTTLETSPVRLAAILLVIPPIAAFALIPARAPTGRPDGSDELPSVFSPVYPDAARGKCNTPRQCARPHQVTGRLLLLFATDGEPSVVASCYT
jgi:hypothetical protein